MSDSYYKSLLLDGKTKKLQELADLATKGRTPSETKRYAAEAQSILLDIAELDDKLADGTADYTEVAEMNVAIVHFLTEIKEPATKSVITKELIRGQFRGHKDERKMAIRVGRCVRAYVVGKASENPKLKERNGLVGLPLWPDSRLA
jgi:hypothetical protein